jgi:hypothetical protein
MLRPLFGRQGARRADTFFCAGTPMTGSPRIETKQFTLPPKNSVTGGRSPSAFGSPGGATFGLAKLKTDVRSPAKIALHGLIHGAIFVTNNDRDFGRIAKLELENWNKMIIADTDATRANGETLREA